MSRTDKVVWVLFFSIIALGLWGIFSSGIKARTISVLDPSNFESPEAYGDFTYGQFRPRLFVETRVEWQLGDDAVAQRAMKQILKDAQRDLTPLVVTADPIANSDPQKKIWRVGGFQRELGVPPKTLRFLWVTVPDSALVECGEKSLTELLHSTVCLGQSKIGVIAKDRHIKRDELIGLVDQVGEREFAIYYKMPHGTSALPRKIEE